MIFYFSRATIKLDKCTEQKQKGGCIRMAINPVEKINSTMTTAQVQKTPAQDKNLESQIATKQQRLKRLASDADMTASEKEQKRREIQKEIDELNRKLREEEAKKKEAAAKAAQKQKQEDALKKEELQEKLNPAKQDETTTSVELSDDQKKHIDMPVKDIQQMLSAEYLIQKERVQEQVDMELQSTIQVLKAEINQDKLYGADTTQKEAELKALQEKENFWTEAAQTTTQQPDDTQSQTQFQAAIHTNTKVVIDQI